MGDFPYLDFLTREYFKKAEKKRYWRDYVKAHGLANFCLQVDPRKKRRQLVYDIEKSWYKGEHPLTNSEHRELSKKHKQLLEEYRDETQNTFDKLKKVADELDENNFFVKAENETLTKFNSEAFKASQACSEGLAEVSRHIIESGVDVLSKNGFSPPCKFAVLGLGSIAKGEATPYSDLEYAFLVERYHEYFKKLAIDSYFRLANLGESPLKTFGIQELKPEGKQLSLATAQLMKAGLRMDGITKNSGNIPTGNGLSRGRRLTLTVDHLMAFYKTSAESPFDGMAGDKSDMLSSTIVIYTNEGTISELHSEFRLKRLEFEDNVARTSETVSEKRLKSFEKDLYKFTFLPDFVEFRPPQNLEVKVKADIFRYPTLLANNIKMCLGLDTRYSWDVYSWMKSKNMLSKENHLYIQTVLALSIYMRTSAYLHQKQQTDFVHINANNWGYKNQFYSVDANCFVILGRLLIPIKHHISTLLGPENQANQLTEPMSCSGRGQLYSLMNQTTSTLLINKTDLLVMAEVLYFAGCYAEAVEVIEDQFGELKLNNMTSYYPIVHRDHIKSVKLCGYLLYNTRDYATALEYFNYLIDSQPGDVMVWKLLSAHCKKEIEDYQSARQLIDEVKSQQHGDITELLETLYGANTKHEDAGSGYTHIGILYHALGEFAEALTCYEASLDIGRDLFGAEANHPVIAGSYNNIGNAYYSLGDYTSALEYYTKSLEMKKAVYGAEANHPGIADSYNNIGGAYFSLGDYTSALEYYTKSLEMRKAVCGAETNHPDIATSYNNIGSAYKGLGEHTSALEYHTKSLEMRKAVFGAEANHPDIAANYNNIGSAYSGLGEYTSALEYHAKSLEMKKAVYGAEANHLDISYSYNNIGTAYKSLGEYTSALEYFTKSLEMRKAVYGTEANHPDIAVNYFSIANTHYQLGDHSLFRSYLAKSRQMYCELFGADSKHPIAVKVSFLSLLSEQLDNISDDESD